MNAPRTPAARVVTARRSVPAAALLRIGRLAVRALYDEAVLYPKPGLVSAVDNGAHRDMSIGTFYQSLFALRRYFPAAAAQGAARVPLPALQVEGIAAEVAMLRATRGINTHRGAIFNLGLLCAASGVLLADGAPLNARAACARVRGTWGGAIRGDLAFAPADTHGMRVARVFGVGGVRAEAAGGFRSVRTWALPAFRTALAVTGDRERAAVHALLALIARVADSNLLWRGGREGLAWAQRSAAELLADGGALAPAWRARTIALHRAFVARRLSPGGSADLLAVTLFLDALESGAWPRR